MQQKSSPLASMKVSDIAVDGLLHGLAAGVVMMLYLILAGLFLGYSPVAMLALFGAEQGVAPINGLLSHLAVSAVYGIIWGFLVGLVVRRTPVPFWLAGLLYGLGLYAVAALLLVPHTALSALAAPHMLVAHLLFGLTLGLLQMRSARAPVA